MDLTAITQELDPMYKVGTMIEIQDGNIKQSCNN